MSMETELKLSVPHHQLPDLLAHPFWEANTHCEPQTFHLGNTYFDTPDRALNQAHIALRIRKKEGSFFQTLKTRGESINGLTRRGEWEWPLSGPQLDLSLIEALDLDQLKGLALDNLTPLFATDFQRTCHNVTWASPIADIEAAIDVGHVVCGVKKSPICELELELKAGNEAALTEVAAQLAKTIDLAPCDKSKAERGFELLNPAV